MIKVVEQAISKIQAWWDTPKPAPIKTNVGKATATFVLLNGNTRTAVFAGRIFRMGSLGSYPEFAEDILHSYMKKEWIFSFSDRVYYNRAYITSYSVVIEDLWLEHES